jgi:hypothetical protein
MPSRSPSLARQIASRDRLVTTALRYAARLTVLGSALGLAVAPRRKYRKRHATKAKAPRATKPTSKSHLSKTKPAKA